MPVSLSKKEKRKKKRISIGFSPKWPRANSKHMHPFPKAFIKMPP